MERNRFLLIDEKMEFGGKNPSTNGSLESNIEKKWNHIPIPKSFPVDFSRKQMNGAIHRQTVSLFVTLPSLKAAAALIGRPEEAPAVLIGRPEPAAAAAALIGRRPRTGRRRRRRRPPTRRRRPAPRPSRTLRHRFREHLFE